MNSAVLVSLLAVLTGGVAVADWGAVVARRKDLETWLKPATLVLLIATVVAAGALDHTAGVWLVVALVLGLVGDIALLDDTVESRFKVGLAAFLFGHLAYVVALAPFVRTAEDSGVFGWHFGGVIVLVLALSLGQIWGILGGAKREGGWALVVPVMLYVLVIATMTVTAWPTESWWVAIGATVFVGSDTILAHNKFVRPLSWARPAIMVTYHVGQALIAVGVLRLLSV